MPLSPLPCGLTHPPLQGVSGLAAPAVGAEGRASCLFAILGPSGAGKTVSGLLLGVTCKGYCLCGEGGLTFRGPAGQGRR